jgi:hypothetical protein
MNVELLQYTPLSVCAKAIRTCWDSHDKSDNGGDMDLALIDRVGNKFKHSSTLEHLVMNFKIKIREDALIQLIENKYVLYKEPFLTINMRSLIDMLRDQKEYLLRNIYLMRIINVIPKEYLYLIEDSLKRFLGEKKDLDNLHWCFENGIVVKHTNSGKNDSTKVPYYKLPNVNKDGYFVISGVNIKGKKKKEFHHRIIGQLFVKNPELKPFINHIDGNKKNNNISNLEWVTSSENESHSFSVLKKEIWNKGKELPSGYEYKGKIRTLGQYDLNGEFIKEWFNPTEAYLLGGFDIKKISDVCCGRLSFYGGFKWKYIGENK